MSQVIIKDVANQTYALMEAKDKELSAIFDKIEAMTACLEDLEYSHPEKYKVIVSIEYLLVRARLLVENEHISVKNILSLPDASVSLKAVFTKRDQYLAQVCMKLTSIREDIANLQKVVYTASNFISK